MKKRNKTIILLCCSIAVLLIILAFFGYQRQWQQKQYFLDNTQRSLVELQGILADQENNNWSNPHIISNQLQRIIDQLNYGTMSHSYPAKGLSADDRELLMQLSSYLQRLPNNETYSLAEWSDADVEKAIIVNNALITAKLKMNQAYSVDWKSFKAQCKVLVEELRPLSSL